MLILACVLAVQIIALFFLYTKESNAWYANILMEQNLKKLANKKAP